MKASELIAALQKLHPDTEVHGMVLATVEMLSSPISVTAEPPKPDPKKRDRRKYIKDMSARPDLITTEAAAEIVGVNIRTIRRRVADGSLPAYRFGPRLLRVSTADVMALFSEIPTAGWTA